MVVKNVRRALPLVALVCSLAASPLPAAAAPQPFCAALKSNLGQALLLQKRSSNQITSLVADLSAYAQSAHWHEYQNAYKEGFEAFDMLDELKKTDAALKRQLADAAAAPAQEDADTAAVTAHLQSIAASENAVEQDADSLISEWNADVVFNARPPGVPHGGSAVASVSQSAPDTAVPVMDVRPLLLRTLQRMDAVSKALGDLHPLVTRGITECFTRSRRQATQTPAPAASPHPLPR